MERVTSMLRARQEELTAPGARSTVIVLPEMSFTGYVFRGRDEILPLEDLVRTIATDSGGKGVSPSGCASELMQPLLLPC